jgi:hypothetical protein
MTASDRTEIYVPEIRYTRRWFCYLDLLGFTRLVQSESIDRILPLYERALRHAEKGAVKRRAEGISYSWFSDTFIIFSRSDTAREFALLEQAGRFFFQELVRERIPVRGALSCGNLYSQLKRNVFIGEALIEAYTYGEGQDWIGFLLTPSAVQRLSEVELAAAERAFYRPVPAEGVLKEGLNGPAYAFTFDNGRVQGRNIYLDALEEMRALAPARAVGKYKRTIAFIRANARRHGGPSPETAA